MTDVYEILNRLFSGVMDDIQRGIYDSAAFIFDNAFFNAALAIAIGWIGFMIAFKKFSSEEAAHKVIFTLLLFGIVKTILFNETYYNYFIDIVNVPRDAFTQAVYELVKRINDKATIDNIINTLYTSLLNITSAIFDKAGMSNLTAFAYGIIVWLSGMFLILVIVLNSIFSSFLSDLVISLLPLVLPTLIWKKTEYVFVSWIKLYVSVSLYLPFTILFGVISIRVADLTMRIAGTVENDFESSVEYLIALVIAQALIALGIFKIPNIVNQLIGSSNEGSSLTSGVGTLSAGGALVSGFSKYTGLSFAAKHSASAAKKGGTRAYDKIMDRMKEKVQMR
ncbi:MAG: type IV secretion system protein [Arcobacteraceae bacterium]|jgi:type IV secretion system protein VirB6|nr:type IV secretion system protein [Arcobacteraceae bacterium]